MPFMRGAMPVRNTLRYLEQGEITLRSKIKVLEITYNTNCVRSQGVRDFVFWHWAQLQYKNPDVQLLKHRNVFPTAFVRAFYFENVDGGGSTNKSAGVVLLDLDELSRHVIVERLIRILGQTEVSKEEAIAELNRTTGPAHFGTYHERQCICEVQGQQPCPELVPPPKYLKGFGRWAGRTDIVA